MIIRYENISKNAICEATLTDEQLQHFKNEFDKSEFIQKHFITLEDYIAAIYSYNS